MIRPRVNRSIVVAALGTAQIVAWGSSYYLPAILADPIAQGLGLSQTTIFGLFSGALLGWRAACLIWATLHIVIGLPLNRLLIPPARATQAASPLLFGLLMDHMGIGVLVVSAGLSLCAFFALLILRARPTAAPAPA